METYFSAVYQGVGQLSVVRFAKVVGNYVHECGMMKTHDPQSAAVYSFVYRFNGMAGDFPTRDRERCLRRFDFFDHDSTIDAIANRAHDMGRSISSISPHHAQGVEDFLENTFNGSDDPIGKGASYFLQGIRNLGPGAEDLALPVLRRIV